MVTKNATIEYILFAHRDALGNDFERYHNHVYRVFNFALLMGKDTLTDNDTEALAIAAGFHDIGIWTHNTFDYLQPSMELAEKFLVDTGKEQLGEEVSLIIDQHHKIGPYYGPYAETVETFRKADWLDVSLSAFAFGISRTQIREINAAFPYSGFHRFLVAQSFKNFVKHPSNPLPMFKR